MAAHKRFYFEDFVPGRVWEATGAVVSSEEIIDFGRKFDPQDFHTDEEKAKLEKQGVDKAPKENMILQQGQCCQLLKTGPKKGSPCLQKVHENNLCLRHFHLTEKK